MNKAQVVALIALSITSFANAINCALLSTKTWELVKVMAEITKVLITYTKNGGIEDEKRR